VADPDNYRVRQGLADAEVLSVEEIHAANLVTACWPCKARKGDLTLDQLGWHTNPPDAPGRWDGLTGLYPGLWAAAGRPNPRLHRDWMRHLGTTA
jgi:hypothetical protein